MSLDAYINPDFTWYKKLFFMLVTLLMMSLCILLIAAVERLLVKKRSDEDWKYEYNDRLNDQVQRFFEMIISGTSVMLFSCAYVVINHIYTLVSSGAASTDSQILLTIVDAWAEGKDFILLLLIVISCVINSILDKFIIPLNRLGKQEKATMRMLGMFYVIIILIYLNYIGDESQYSPVMMYYFGLMIGRFVYFDASFMDFIEALKNIFFNIPFLLLTMVAVGVLCTGGFYMEFFLERNYYIVGIFYTHLFMLLGVFVFHWILWAIRRKDERRHHEEQEYQGEQE